MKTIAIAILIATIPAAVIAATVPPNSGWGTPATNKNFQGPIAGYLLSDQRETPPELENDIIAGYLWSD